jgi:hypothetical protein
MAMEAMLSEFDYFTPTIIQSAVVGEYDDVISPVNAINPSASTGLNTLEFNIPGAADLYRDLNNSYLMVKVKIVQASGASLAGDAKVAPVNLFLHSLFSNASVTLCGKEISEKDTLYPYRAYLETLLTYNPDVLKSRMVAEGWCKDDAGTADNLVLVDDTTNNIKANAGFVERNKLAAASPTLVLVGRPHVDLFHQALDLPPNCAITLKLTPSSGAFHIMEASTGTTKVVLQEARLFVRTKKVAPELVLAHKEMLQKGNMRFPLNRVTVSRYGIATGFKSISIPMNFPAKLPKRLFIGLVANVASGGQRDKNPFNFQNFGLEDLTLTVNGVQVPMSGLQMDFEKKDYMRAYLSTLQALGCDNDNRAIDITPKDFAGGFTIYGFKVAPGPVDGAVHTLANSVGSISANLTFASALTENVDMIVLAETPAILEIDKLSSVNLV